jgi:Cu-Zn family superoxide dismutase
MAAFMTLPLASHAADKAPFEKAEAQLEAKSGAKGLKGDVKFERLGTGGVRVIADITGLEPNSTHGFHIHQHGDCSDQAAKKAGEHLNPTDKKHGPPMADTEHHLGDMGNVTADAKGHAVVDRVFDQMSLDPKSANTVVGKAVILHAKADDLKSQPSGNSGDRIACGVIKE